MSTDIEELESNPGFSRAVSLITAMLVNRPSKELLALAINLSLSEENAQVMASGDGVGSLLKRVTVSYDPLLMKLVRNISESHDIQVKLKFTRYLHSLSSMVMQADQKGASQDFIVNALATLSNITVVCRYIHLYMINPDNLDKKYKTFIYVCASTGNSL